MVRKKKIIWWESEPSVGGAEQARARGTQDDPARRSDAHSPYYGPVTIDWDADADDDTVGLVS